MPRFLAALGLMLALLLATSGAGSSAAPPRAGFSTSGTATLTGTRVGPSVFTTAGVAKECEETAVNGTLENDSPGLELEPVFGDCVAKTLSGLAVKFVIGGCTFSLRPPAPLPGGRRWRSKVDLRCPGELPFEWSVYENAHAHLTGDVMCGTGMEPQRGIGSAILTPVAGDPSALRIEWNLDGFEYTAAGFELLCGSVFGEPQNDASYRGTTRLSAEDASGAPLDLTVTG